MPGFEQVAKYHPLFLYESLLNLIAAGLLILINRKWRSKLFTGDLFLLYLVLYPTIRFFLEFLRLDPSPVNGININQTSMLVVLVVAVLLLVLRHTVWAEGLKTREENLDAERAEEIALMEAEKAAEEMEAASETAEETEKSLEEAAEAADEAADEATEEIEEAVDEASDALENEEIAPAEEVEPDEEPKLDDDISSYPNE